MAPNTRIPGLLTTSADVAYFIRELCPTVINVSIDEDISSPGTVYIGIYTMNKSSINFEQLIDELIPRLPAVVKYVLLPGRAARLAIEQGSAAAVTPWVGVTKRNPMDPVNDKLAKTVALYRAIRAYIPAAYATLLNKV